jgi:hypothetical protein
VRGVTLGLIGILLMSPEVTQAQQTPSQEVDFIARIQASPEIAKEIGLAKLTADEQQRLNSLLNAAYALGFEAGRKVNSDPLQGDGSSRVPDGEVRIGGIQRDRPCGSPIPKGQVELIQVAPEDAGNVYEYAEKNGLEITARWDGQLGAARTVTGTARADSAKRGCPVVFHMYLGAGDRGLTMWNEFTKSYQTLKSQAVVYWFAMPKQK